MFSKVRLLSHCAVLSRMAIMRGENGFLKSFSFRWCIENNITSSLEVSKSRCVSSAMIALLLFFIQTSLFSASRDNIVFFLEITSYL